jgi:group I intron endonuclease
MTNIYKITNTITGKAYIGATSKPVNARWKQHIHDSRKDRCKFRSLYQAIRKYGKDNFEVQLIEITDDAETRERYWITFYDTFRNGYNDTLGGAGRSFVDEELVISTYKRVSSKIKTAELLKLDKDTVHDILDKHSHEIRILKNVPNSKPVYQYTMDGERIEWFESSGEAARKIIKLGLSHGNSHSTGNRIRDVANGKMKSAYGYIWKFA